VEQAVTVAAFAENLGYGAADGSEAHQGYAARGSAIPWNGGIGVRCLFWRSLLQGSLENGKSLYHTWDL
jgi:hypothetical protein